MVECVFLSTLVFQLRISPVCARQRKSVRGNSVSMRWDWFQGDQILKLAAPIHANVSVISHENTHHRHPIEGRMAEKAIFGVSVTVLFLSCLEWHLIYFWEFLLRLLSGSFVEVINRTDSKIHLVRHKFGIIRKSIERSIDIKHVHWGHETLQISSVGLRFTR